MRLSTGKLLQSLASLRLSCVLLFLLLVLTYLGTIFQVEHGIYAAQKVYFESLYVAQPVVGGLVLPLPGGFLVMVALFVNLLAGGIVRLRRKWSRVGILVTHVGISVMLLAGFVKFLWGDEGSVQLFEGDRASEYVSYHDWEIAIQEPLEDGSTREYLIPGSRFVGLDEGETATFTHASLPFRLIVSGYLPSARPRRVRSSSADPGVVDGFELAPAPLEKQAELNRAGCSVIAEEEGGARQKSVLWAASRGPWTVSAGGERFGVALRKKRIPLPFTLRLDKFTHAFHPGTSMPRLFMSDVAVVEGDVVQPVKIQMNEPLRRENLIVFQSSWGPANARPGDPLYSGFAVVRNPADQWPLYSCLIIAAGLLFHFSRGLVSHIRTTTGVKK